MKARAHPVHAAIYDPVMRMAERGKIGLIRKQLLSGLHGDIVEIGAGTGADFYYYATEARVLALEPDRFMLARARDKATASRGHITLQHGGDEMLETLPRGGFDAAVCALVLCSVDDPLVTLARIRRVLRPGGKLAVMEHVRSRGMLGAVQDRLRPLWERIAAGCQLNRDTKSLIALAGFDVSALRYEHIPGVIVRDVLVGVAT